MATFGWTIGIALALGITMGAIGLWVLGTWTYDRTRTAIADAPWRSRPPLRIGSMQVFGTGWLRTLLQVANSTGFLLWRILIAILWFLAVVLVLPIWQQLPDAVWAFVESTLSGMGRSLVAYLPNLGRIVFIIILFRLGLGMIKWVFEEIRRERIRLRHFDRSWARQTYTLVRFAAVALATILIFPLLPGSGTTGFQGIAIFIGALVSIGASSAVSNAVAGVVLTYTKAFDRGERVRIHDTTGDIVSRSMFVTHIRNLRNEEIAIPNQLVLAGPITNYSRDAGGNGVAVEVRIGLGYDVPWRRAHELLKTAADIEGVRKDPEPRIYQEDLGDHAVLYVLHAFIEDPRAMVTMRSQIMQRALDLFGEAGIEIVSPSQHAVREGAPVLSAHAPTGAEEAPAVQDGPEAAPLEEE